MGNPTQNSGIDEVKQEYEEFFEPTEECNFWESEVNLLKKCSKVEGKKVLYYGHKQFFSFIFFHWTRKWIDVLSKNYLDPYKLHPLPKSDQILYWQPIFSKYVSDSLIELEEYEFETSQSKNFKGLYKTKKLILVRAIFYTFWKRILLAMIGMIVMNILSMSIAILLSKLLKFMTSSEYQFGSILGLVISIILLELFKGICIDHVTFYIQRLIVMVEYSLGITLFQHALCLRKNYSNNDSSEYKCNNRVHTFNYDSQCSQNPFMCSARRHKNMDVNPKMYTYKFVDCYYVPLIFDNLTDIVTFLTNFIYGMILIHVQMKIEIWPVFIVSVILVFIMILLEVLNAFLLKYYFGIRDHRISKSFEVITNFKLIRSLALEDLADNTLTDVRNDELVLVVYRFFISIANKVIYSICVTCGLLMIIKDFINQLNRTSDVKSIESSAIITLLFILLKIIDPMYMLPVTLRLLIFIFNSYNRIEFFVRTCSPNYYQSDKFLVDPSLQSKMFTNKSLVVKRKDKLSYLGKISQIQKQTIEHGCVVKFEKASFGWIHKREELLMGNKDPYLQNLNFNLSRGEFVIVTGTQGSGKSNFIKSILGEMTLMSGSMYVSPLSKSMPIFYASQEVWLKRGSIRSNITFGHLFDEKIYSEVIKAVDLETDISSWEDGDMRVISDSGFGLSGGQRVRIELARALYSYLVYSKVTREYGKNTSFLMCLDCVFMGLDPFVGGNIFYNLFNVKNGILIRPDLSVVLTTSKRMLETCLSSTFDTFGDVKMYTLKKKTLIQKSDLKTFILNKFQSSSRPENKSKKCLEKKTKSDDHFDDSNVKEELNENKINLFKKCKSIDFTREGRKNVVISQYDNRNEYGCYKIEGYKSIRDIVFGPLLMYIKAAGTVFFFFIFFLVTCTVLDNMRYIFASKLSNYVNDQIKKISEPIEQFSGNNVHSLIRDYSTKSYKLIASLSVFVILTSITVVILMTMVSFNASLKIHEYSLDSSLYNSSTFVKIKRYLSDVITFLSCDTLFVDVAMGYYLFDTFVLLVETLIHMIMLIYLVPTSFFFVFIASFFIICFPMMWFIKAVSNIRFAYMASVNRINCVLNDSISGSLVYRTYRKESELVTEFVEHTDYNSRCRFMERSTYTWASVTCRIIFSVMIFFIILTPLTLSTVSTYNIKIGYYGLAFSLSLNFTNRFSKLLRVFTRLQLYLCSIKRFENFIPINEKLKFKPKRNVYVEHILVNTIDEDDLKDEYGNENQDVNELFSCKDFLSIKNKYVSRRKMEFYTFRSKMSVRSLFFKPKVNIIDVTEYLDKKHKNIKLKNVYVLGGSFKSFQTEKLPEFKLDSKDGKENDTKKDEDILEVILDRNLDNVKHEELKEKYKKRFILMDINQEAYRSHIIGIIGRTGSGKTTLLSVILNILNFRKGSVLLDGVELNQLPPELLRQIVGVLPQLPFVFRGWTIRRFLDPRRLFSDDQINEALEMCGLLDFVLSLSDQPLDLVILPDYYHKAMPKYLKRVYYPTHFNLKKLSSLYSSKNSYLKSNKELYKGSYMEPKSVEEDKNFKLSKKLFYSSDDIKLSNTQMRTLIFARLMLYRKFYRLILIDEPPSDNCSDDQSTPVISPKTSFTTDILEDNSGQIGLPIYKLLSQYFRHCTCFIAAHDANALKSCTRLWILSNGNLVMTCDKEQMIHDESLAKMIQDCVEN